MLINQTQSQSSFFQMTNCTTNIIGLKLNNIKMVTAQTPTEYTNDVIIDLLNSSANFTVRFCLFI